MQKLRAFLTMVLSTAFFMAAAHPADYQAGAVLFGYQVVPQGVGFSVENLTCNGTDEYAIVSDGEPAAFLMAGANSSGNLSDIVKSERSDAIYNTGTDGAGGKKNASPGPPQPVTGVQGIADALRCYYVANGHTQDPAPFFAAIHGEIAQIENNHKRGEAGCRLLLGTDRTECVSFESCQKACYSVTSFCQPVALGAGRDFVNAIWKFENQSRELGAAYSAEGKAYSAFAKNASEGRALAYLDAIGNASAIAESAAASPLFYDYSFCFSPDYPVYELSLLKSRAEKQYKNASVYYNISASAKAIANGTELAIEKKSRYILPKIEETGNAGASNTSNGTGALQLEEQAGPQNLLVEFFARIFSFFFGGGKT